jgi:hypothetical protein
VTGQLGASSFTLEKGRSGGLDRQIGVSCAIVASRVVVTQKLAEEAGNDPMKVSTRDAVDRRHVLEANNKMVEADTIGVEYFGTWDTRFLAQDEVSPYTNHIYGRQAVIDDAGGLLIGHGGFVPFVSYDVFLYKLAQLLDHTANQQTPGHYDHQYSYFIVNTANGNTDGSHWVTVTVDIKPERDQQQPAVRTPLSQTHRSARRELKPRRERTGAGRGARDDRGGSSSASRTGSADGSSSSLWATGLAQLSKFLVVFFVLVARAWAVTHARIVREQYEQRDLPAPEPVLPAVASATVDPPHMAALPAAPAPALVLQEPLEQSGPAEEQPARALPLLAPAPHSPEPNRPSRKRARKDTTPGVAAKRARLDTGAASSKKRQRLF